MKNQPAPWMIDAQPGSAAADEVIELVANIDDMTGEHLTVAFEQLLSAGALDVTACPALMKKGRMGHVLTVLVRPEDAERLSQAVLHWTTTAGVRWRVCPRRTAEVYFQSVETTYGPVTVKFRCHAEGWHYKAEADQVAALALKHGISYEQAYRAVTAAVEQQCTHPKPH